MHDIMCHCVNDVCANVFKMSVCDCCVQMCNCEFEYERERECVLPFVSFGLMSLQNETENCICSVHNANFRNIFCVCVCSTYVS